MSQDLRTMLIEDLVITYFNNANKFPHYHSIKDFVSHLESIDDGDLKELYEDTYGIEVEF